MALPFPETGNTARGWEERLKETAVRVISKTLSVSTQQLLEESGRQEFVVAVDADLTEEESGKTDLECLAERLASRRASKQDSHLLLILRARTSRSPGEVAHWSGRSPGGPWGPLSIQAQRQSALLSGLGNWRTTGCR